MSTYYELQPAYGQDYKTKAEVTQAWKDGKDFLGDCQLGFKPVNIRDIPKPCTVDYKRAAQNAIQVQDACNLSGVAHSYWSAIEAICERANQLGQGTRWKNTHVIVTMFLLKMAELNGCGSTLHETYTQAEELCKRIAVGDVPEGL